MFSSEPSKAQVLVDVHITKLETALLKLKSIRNSGAYVSKLPSETLAEVFLLAASEYQAYGPARRFNFSFVCQDWRNVALASPRVWSFLVNRYSPWSHLILQRSKSSELRVHIDLYRHGLPSATSNFSLDVLQNHMPRIQELEIVSKKHDDLHQFLDALPISAPLLHTLRIDKGWPSRSAKYIPTLSSEVLGDARLSSLRLHRCNVDWSAPFLRQGAMQHLKIGGVPSQSPLQHICDALRLMPALRTLEFENTLPVSSDRLPTTTAPLSFSHLEQLTIISSPISTVANLLRHLVLPKVANLNLRCTDSEPHSSFSAFEDFVASFQQLFLSMTPSRAQRVLPYHTLSISGEVDESVKIKIWRHLQAGDKTPLLGPHLNLIIETTKSSLVVVPPLLKLLPISQLQEATIHAKMYRKDLMASLGRLQDLRTLYVDSTSAQQIIQALSYKQSKDADANYYHVQFPSLQNLHLRDIVFSDRYNTACVTIYELRDCLMDRCYRQAPIHKVHIESSYDIGQEDIRLLREIGVDVKWDNRKHSYGDVLKAREEEPEPDSDSEVDSQSDSDEGSEDSEDYSHVDLARSNEDVIFSLRNGYM